MNDRVYPASRPAGGPPAGGASAGVGNGVPTYTKSQLYSANRPAYRPQPKRRRSKRRCCCLCSVWTCVVVLFLILLLAIAGAVVWVLFWPQRPTFSVTSLEIATLNVTGGPRLNSQILFSIDARNPNKKVEFFYDDISFSLESEGISLGSGSIKGFDHPTKNTTTVSATVSQKDQPVDSAGAIALAADLKENSVPVTTQLETKVKAKLGALKSGRIPIRVSCNGFSAAVGKTKGSNPSLSNGKCAIKVKVLKWEI